MTCHYAFHIYDMNCGDFGKIIKKCFSYKEALKELQQLEDKNDGTHDYVIL